MQHQPEWNRNSISLSVTSHKIMKFFPLRVLMAIPDDFFTMAYRNPMLTNSFKKPESYKLISLNPINH